MNILRILTSLFLTVLPVAVLVRDWKYYDKRTRKHHEITRRIIVFWLIASMVATFFVWSDTKNIEGLIGINKDISDKLTKYQKKLEIKNEKIITLSEENKILNQEISDWVTGGDSSCFIMATVDQISDRQMLNLFHQGKNPLFDVVISIEDRNKEIPIARLYDEIIQSHKEDVAQGREKQRDFSLEMNKLLNSRIIQINVGTLPPSTTQELLRLRLPSKDSQEFFVKIMTRNGYFTQSIKLKKINGSWRSSWQLLRHERNGELKEIPTLIPSPFKYEE